MPQSAQHEDETARKPPSALARALLLLRSKSRSEADLRAQLVAQGYALGDIDDAIRRAQGYGYVNDGRLADSVAHAAQARGKGPAWVARELRRRQVAEAPASEAMAEARRQAAEGAHGALRRGCGRRLDCTEPRGRARALRFLLARGFDFDDALAATAARAACQRKKEGEPS